MVDMLLDICPPACINKEPNNRHYSQLWITSYARLLHTVVPTTGKH